MPYYVYVLKSEKDGKRYIGFTDNIERRFIEHCQGKVKSTKNRRPIVMIYTEEFLDKANAMKREAFFKTHSGRNFLESIGK